ncbi:MAG: hypothetical protein K2H05_09010 [Duncaniella sp.]|nr:hypothetical protein [Duncaniella sp.]
MKTKLFLFISLFMGLVLASCNDDDDYTIVKDPLLSEDSVVTGSADVTATTATLNGTVKGLGNTDPSSYTVGFNYGYTADNLHDNVTGALDGENLVATLTGLTENTTLYYQAFVTLQKRITYVGEVKSLVTTNTKVTTAAPEAVAFNGAKVGLSVTGAPADATFGVVIASVEDAEAVRAGLSIPFADASTLSAELRNLAPATTYYYAGYADLGSGIVYGDVQTFKTSPYEFDLDNDLVDLGLSVRWARYNVGASSENEAGGLFGYGDVTGVNNSIDVADYASGDIYKTSADIANRAWGGKVTLPTAAEFEELFNSCSKEWTEVDGVAGFRLTGPNGNSIFLPAAGSRTISEISSAGIEGRYATGSINAGDAQFAVSYRFGSAGSSRTTTPLYEALSVRPVSTARNVPFKKELLCKTWEIDYNEGECLVFNGPVWFYGTQDSWRTVSNGEPIVGDSWLWDADKTNTWAFGNCNGSMTINADGTIVVKDHNGVEQTGTYTLDEDEKTITATIDLLAPDNFISPLVENRKTAIKILSLTDDKAQFGFFRDSEPATLSVNMIPANKKYGFPVNLCVVGSDWNGEWAANMATLLPAELDGVHTLKYEGSCVDGMVWNVDIAGLRAAYPNAIASVKEIRLDGKAIVMDANKLFYGDIEDNGNFRVELFNIYGKGAKDGLVVESAFSSATNAGSEPALAFSKSIEMDLVILCEPTFTPNWVSINKDWAGDWNYNQGASFNVVVDGNNKLVFENPSFDITLNANGIDFTEGTIMTFVQVDNFYTYFPQTHAVLDALYKDGVKVTGYDASKVLDTNDGTPYRLELWNCYGATGNNCAFGTRNGDLMPGLGFKDSQRAQFTFKHLFNSVAW